MCITFGNPENAIKEIEDIIGIPAEDAPRVSAKTGLNVEQVLEAIVDGMELEKPGKGIAFVIDVPKVAGITHGK